MNMGKRSMPVSNRSITLQKVNPKRQSTLSSPLILPQNNKNTISYSNGDGVFIIITRLYTLYLQAIS